MDVRDVGDVGRHVTRAAEERGVALGIMRVIAVHGTDGALAHVAGDDEGAFPNEEDKFAKATIFKVGAHGFEFVIGDDAAFAHALKSCGDALAGVVIEEPEAGHGAVIDDVVIRADAQAEGVDVLCEIEMLVAVGHAVIAEDMQGDAAVVLMGEFERLSDPGFVFGELGVDLRGLIADTVQEAIKAGPVLEGEADALGGNVGVQAVAIGFLAHIGVGDEVGNLFALRADQRCFRRYSCHWASAGFFSP